MWWVWSFVQDRKRFLRDTCDLSDEEIMYAKACFIYENHNVRLSRISNVLHFIPIYTHNLFTSPNPFSNHPSPLTTSQTLPLTSSIPPSALTSIQTPLLPSRSVTSFSTFLNSSLTRDCMERVSYRSVP